MRAILLDMMRIATGVLLFSLLLVGCGQAGLLDGVGDRTRSYVQGDDSTTSTLVPVIAGVGDEGLIGVAGVQWFNDAIASKASGTPDDVIAGVWERELNSRFVQSSRVEIAAALPSIMFPALVPQAARWITSQLVYDLSTGNLDPDTSAAFGIWTSDPYQSANSRLGVLRVGSAASDVLSEKSDIVSIIVPDGVSLGWTEEGHRYELFCRSDISEELCGEMANSTAPLNSLLP